MDVYVAVGYAGPGLTHPYVALLWGKHTDDLAHTGAVEYRMTADQAAILARDLLKMAEQITAS